MKIIIIDTLGYVYAGAGEVDHIGSACAVTTVTNRRELPTRYKRAQYFASVTLDGDVRPVGMVHGCESLEGAMRLSGLVYPWSNAVVTVYYTDLHGNATAIATGKTNVLGERIWKIF